MKVGAQGHHARKWDLNNPGSTGLFLIQASGPQGVLGNSIVRSQVAEGLVPGVSSVDSLEPAPLPGLCRPQVAQGGM